MGLLAVISLGCWTLEVYRHDFQRRWKLVNARNSLGRLMHIKG